jgi:hypothetical protein
VAEEHIGSRRWHSMGRWPQQTKEVAGSVLRRFLAEDSGSAASLAWLRGAQERSKVTSAQRLEQRRRREVEWSAWCSAAIAEEERTGFSFGPTA